MYTYYFVADGAATARPARRPSGSKQQRDHSAEKAMHRIDSLGLPNTSAHLQAFRTLCLASGLLAACGSNPQAPSPGGVAASPTSTLPTTGTAGSSSSATPTMQPAATPPAQPTGGTAPVSAPSGAAGAPSSVPSTMSPSMAAGAQAGAPATQAPPPSAGAMAPQTGLAMDECGLKTSWRGDEYCIKAPPPEKGFQIHYGPTSYDNPDPKFIMQPGGETVESIPAMTGNTTDKYYYWRQYRMRPGTHHLIVTATGANGRRLGGAQNLAYDNPDRGEIPAENQDVGMPIAANTPVNLSLHYINTTDKPILKEVWINFWYRDPADVKEPALELYSFAPMNVAPGQHVVIHGECPVMNDGRILTLYGHRHANNLRFSIWRQHGTDKTLVYEDYDWEEPLLLEYTSLDVNPAADPSKKMRGGFSGMLNVASGDMMTFECEIVNMSNKTFYGANEAKDDEMCIMIGDTVKSTVSNRCTYTTKQVTSQ
jgi:hypothetical protein